MSLAGKGSITLCEIHFHTLEILPLWNQILVLWFVTWEKPASLQYGTNLNGNLDWTVWTIDCIYLLCKPCCYKYSNTKYHQILNQHSPASQPDALSKSPYPNLDISVASMQFTSFIDIIVFSFRTKAGSEWTILSSVEKWLNREPL